MIKREPLENEQVGKTCSVKESVDNVSHVLQGCENER